MTETFVAKLQSLVTLKTDELFNFYFTCLPYTLLLMKPNWGTVNT